MELNSSGIVFAAFAVWGVLFCFVRFQSKREIYIISFFRRNTSAADYSAFRGFRGWEFQNICYKKIDWKGTKFFKIR